MTHKKMIEELKKTMNESEIARAVGCDQSTIWRLMNVRFNPTYNIAIRIEKLARDKGIIL